MPNMTGRPGYRTMEMNGGSSAPYLARTPCVPLFSTLFNGGGNKERFRLPGAGGGSFPLYSGTCARWYSVSKIASLWKAFNSFCKKSERSLCRNATKRKSLQFWHSWKAKSGNDFQISTFCWLPCPQRVLHRIPFCFAEFISITPHPFLHHIFHKVRNHP